MRLDPCGAGRRRRWDDRARHGGDRDRPSPRRLRGPRAVHRRRAPRRALAGADPARPRARRGAGDPLGPSPVGLDLRPARAARRRRQRARGGLAHRRPGRAGPHARVAVARPGRPRTRAAPAHAPACDAECSRARTRARPRDVVRAAPRHRPLRRRAQRTDLPRRRAARGGPRLPRPCAQPGHDPARRGRDTRPRGRPAGRRGRAHAVARRPVRGQRRDPVRARPAAGHRAVRDGPGRQRRRHRRRGRPRPHRGARP